MNLKVLAYLWQRDQEELLDEMIEAQVEAILIKTAALGVKQQAYRSIDRLIISNSFHFE